MLVTDDGDEMCRWRFLPIWSGTILQKISPACRNCHLVQVTNLRFELKIGILVIHAKLSIDWQRFFMVLYKLVKSQIRGKRPEKPVNDSQCIAGDLNKTVNNNFNAYSHDHVYLHSVTLGQTFVFSRPWMELWNLGLTGNDFPECQFRDLF